MGMQKATSPGFQFITSINTVARNDETRRKVRSHARRHKLPNETSPAHVEKSGTQKERTSKFRLKSSTTSKTSSSHTRSNAVVKVRAVEQSPQGGRISGGNFETAMLTQELGLTVVRELPTFSLLRIETTPLTENLLKYCFTVCLSPRETVVQKWFDRAGAPTYMNTYYSGFLANAFAMNPNGNWFDSIQVDDAATHAFLAMIAAMHNSLAQWHDYSTFDFHRLQAIKSINKRLNLEGKNSDTPVSEGVIVAVALLVNNEAFTGSISTAAAHMSGLKRMVDLRGGIIEGFKHSTMLQRALAWSDFSYATAANQPLMFPFVPQLASSLSLYDRFQSRSLVASMEPLGSKDLIIRNREAIELFELMYSITHCLNSFDYTNLENMSTERIQVSDSIYLVEWRLCQLEELSRARQAMKRAGSLPLTPPSDEVVQENGASPIDISETLIYASHLFLHLALRGQPPAASRHRALTEALMSSLCDTLLTLDLLSDPEPYGSPTSHHSSASGSDHWPATLCEQSSSLSNTDPDSPLHPPKDDLHANILLWALFVGSCVRVPVARTDYESPFMYQTVLLGDHHEFFANALRNYCGMRGIADLETLAGKLRDVMWLNSWCENQLALIWVEIGESIVGG
ncbi:hypothetical protein F5Y15DRAFT_426158 [Xylariaceae sp. FL0016]|nr:hypothetical protein F5Y15DRAFT_426158 [Xylariaceae sp. FL0016]